MNYPKTTFLKLLLPLVLLLAGWTQAGAQCTANFTSTVSGTTVSFAGTSNIPPGNWVVYNWNFGDGTNGWGQNVSHTYSLNGQFAVCMTALDSTSGCFATFCDSVTITGASTSCIANFVFSTSNNPTVNFYNQSQGNFTNVEWLFGDGSPNSTQFSPTHTFTSSGTYTVCLLIYNSTNCADTLCQTVSVTVPNCNANFNSSTSGLNASFTNTSTGGTNLNYNWNFGDGSSSNAANPTHTYASSGTYTVCLLIFNSTNCTDTLCQTVSVTAPNCNANFNSSTSGLNANFTNTSTGGTNLSYNWNFGDGSSSVAANPAHTYASSGTYMVCLFISDQISCYDSICMPVTVTGGGSNCNASFTSTTSGLTAGFNNTSSGGLSPFYYWQFGDGATSTATSPSHVYSTAGTYTVCLTMTDSSGCNSNFCDSVVVTSPNPGNCDASFTVNASAYTAFLTSNSSSSVLTHSWIFGDGNSSSAANPSHTYANAGTYTVCHFVYDTLTSCVDSSCAVVTIIGNPSGNCAANFSQNVSGSNFSGQNTSTGSYTNSYWDFGDGNSSFATHATHSYANAGVYVVCLTVSDSGGTCLSTYCDSVVINSGNTNCSSYFVHYPDSTGQYGIIGVNLAQGSNLAYSWNWGDGNTSTGAYPMHTYASAGTYIVCLTVTNATCTDTYCDTITVTQKVSAPLTINIIGTSTAVEEELNASALEVYPNPFAGNANIKLSLNQASEVNLELMALDGRNVLRESKGLLNSGDHTLELSVGNLPNGIYLLKVQTGDQFQVKKIMLSR